MTIALGNRNVSIGSVIAVIGGVLTVLGGILAWESVSLDLAAQAGTSASQSGFETNPGKIIAGCGILAIVLVVLAVLEVKLPFKLAVALTALGAIAALLGVLNFFTVTDDVNKLNALLPAAGSMGVGLYFSILGGLLVLAGGLADLVMKKD